MTVPYNEETELDLEYPVVYARLSPIEGEVGVNADGWLHLVNPTYDLEQVATRQAGYTVEPYVAIDGRAQALPVSATTSLEVQGYSDVPIQAPEPLAVPMNASSRWIATKETYNGLLWAPVAGDRPFALEAGSGAPPDLYDDLYSYTLGTRRVSATVLDFSGAESLSARVEGWPGVVAVAAVVLRRSDTPWYGIFDFEEPGGSSSAYASLRYTADDELQAWHRATKMITVRRISSETDLVLVGMAVDDASGLLAYTAVTAGRRTRRSIVLPGDTDLIPTSGSFTIGQALGTVGSGAIMQVLDVSVRVGPADEDSLDDLMSRYVGLYLASDNEEVGDE